MQTDIATENTQDSSELEARKRSAKKWRKRFIWLPIILSILMVPGFVATALTGFASPAVAGCTDGPQKGVDWAHCRKNNLILRGLTLEGADLRGTDLTSTDLSDTMLDGANLTKANLLRALLDGSSLKGANLEKVAGSRARFHNTDLTNANFEKSEMPRADFFGSTLHDVKFTKAELGRVTFSSANLANVNFDFAILARADFRGADLSGPISFTSAHLYLTRFEGQDLLDTTGLTQSQINLSCGNSETVLPEGLTHPETWPCNDDTAN